MSPAVALAVTGLTVAVVVMTGVWAWRARGGNAGAADAVFTLLVAGLAMLYATQANGMPGRRLAIASMIGAWGARLAVYSLYGRAIRRATSDADVELRDVADHYREVVPYWRFALRAAAAWLLSMPALVASINVAPELATVEYAGAAVWLVGFAGASTADRQLLHIMADPANADRRCEVGLWRYSRRPNYYFELITWAGVGLFALGSPPGSLALASAALLLVARSWRLGQ